MRWPRFIVTVFDAMRRDMITQSLAPNPRAVPPLRSHRDDAGASRTNFQCGTSAVPVRAAHRARQGTGESTDRMSERPL